jgi:hypothetical protein
MKPLRIGVCLESLGLPLRQGLQEIERLGVTGVQVNAVGELAPRMLSQTGRREVRHLLRPYNLELTGLLRRARGERLAYCGCHDAASGGGRRAPCRRPHRGRGRDHLAKPSATGRRPPSRERNHGAPAVTLPPLAIGPGPLKDVNSFVSFPD